MVISFNTDMQKEKIATILLVVIVVGALSVYLAETYYPDIVNNFSQEEKIIEMGDYVDVNYIGRYASNDTIFDSSYNDSQNRTGGTPLRIFVNTDPNEAPSSKFGEYSNMVVNKTGDEFFVRGFINGLIGMKKGESGVIGPLSPGQAYGVTPKIGDIINLSSFYKATYNLTYNVIYEIVDIQENMSMPADYIMDLGNKTTTLYTLREAWHYIGEINNDLYPSPEWKNSTVVTKINETKIWMYTTPPNNLSENFTWIISDINSGMRIQFPENSSSISSINNTTIVITHNPKINSTINVTSSIWGYVDSYTVENVTNDTIITYYTNSTGNKSYFNFERNTIIPRNSTRNITIEAIPGETLEEYVFSSLRSLDSNFTLSLHPLANQTVYFEVEIVDVHKAS
ncbi:MAG: hypothetical protein DRO67_04065 [Candidatus Asgardarchaeum californiense]|nr:MAG: hypothetical protein DRO67_04065 [Candidatus Asgardarchaeum californiense]